MKKVLLLFAVITALFTSCAKLSDPTIGPDQLKAIALGKDTLNMYVGDVLQIDVTLTPSSYDKASLIWKSSDSTVIAVTNEGQLTAKKTGTAKITVSNKTNTVSVNFLTTVVPKVYNLKLGLIAYYPFNYDSAVDSSGKGNDGTIYDISSVPDRFGKINCAYYFNGASSYVKVKDNQDLRLNNTDFTLNYWVNLDEYINTTGSAVLAKNNGPYQNGWNTSITGYQSATTEAGKVGSAFYNVSGGGDPFAVGNKTIELHKWTMITVVYNNQEHSISFYNDGVLDVTISNIPTPNAQTNADLFIGKNSYFDPSGATPPYFIKGKLDDIRIYKRALKGVEVSALFNLPY